MIINSGSSKVETFTESALPAAATWAGRVVYVSDRSTLAWSNGTAWRLLGVTDVRSESGVFVVDATVNGAFVLLDAATPLTLLLPNSAWMGFTFHLVQQGLGSITLDTGPTDLPVRSNKGWTTINQHAVAKVTCISNTDGFSAEWLVQGDTHLVSPDGTAFVTVDDIVATHDGETVEQDGETVTHGNAVLYVTDENGRYLTVAI